MGFPGGSHSKRIRLQCGRPGFNSWVEKIPWRRAWQPTPVFLPGEPPWKEEPYGLQFTGSQRVRHNWATKYTQMIWLEWNSTWKSLLNVVFKRVLHFLLTSNVYDEVRIKVILMLMKITCFSLEVFRKFFFFILNMFKSHSVF